MMTKEKALQVKPLLENEAFVRELAAAETAKDILRLFHDRGVTVDAGDLREITDAMTQTQPAEGDEIAEDQLENVAGGCAARWCIVNGVKVLFSPTLWRLFSKVLIILKA